MEIVKIGKKNWQNAVICQVHPSFLLPMFFTVQSYWILLDSFVKH